MTIEGRLSISMNTRDGHQHQVLIDSSRPVHASRIFHGKAVDEALHMLPMLFSVCATAQACAGVRACEQALHRCASPRVERLRDALVNMETVREHLWRIMLDWPGFLGQAPQPQSMTAMLALQQDYRQAMTGGVDAFQPSQTQADADADADITIPDTLLQRLEHILQHNVFDHSPTSWLEMTDLDQLQSWATSSTTVAAQLLDRIMQLEWHAIGQCQVQALPVLDTEQLRQVMRNDDFIVHPQWADHCCETTSLTRVDSTLLQLLREHYGNGLLVRMVALLTELAQLSSTLMPDTIDTAVGGSGEQDTGIGHSSAARGQLHHCVQVHEQSISSYRILAPTEWNFHPQGVVASSLATLTGDQEQIDQQARLLINAIDPCVDYDLRVQ